MCIPDVEATRPPFVQKPTTKSVVTQKIVVSSERPEEKTTTQPAVTKPTISVVKVRSTRKLCRILYTKNEVNYFYVEKIRACALHCTKDGAFTARDKETLEEWINGLAYMCALLCVFAIFAVVCNYSKTNFPERPIVFITVCYFFYSIAFIIRIVIGREGTSCQEEGGEHYLLLDGSGNISCATTFLLAYCFSMAQSIWWVVLTVCWFLSAGMRWKSERIKKKAAYFHFFAWGVPCAKTVVILVLRKIDVNELSGMCFVGNRYENLGSLRAFVLGPLFTYLIMGVTFLIFGFVARFIAVFRPPISCCEDQEHNTKYESRLLPTGVYAALHTFFSTYILASYFYEYVNKEIWFTDPSSSGPNFEVFLLRTVMDFAIGITAASWLLLAHVPRLCSKLRLRLSEPEVTLSEAQLQPLRQLGGGGGTNQTSI